MSTINATLSMAKRALLANQGAMATAGDNVANVNTPGYARRRVDLRPAPTELTPFGGLGSGVQLYGVDGVRDRFVEQQLQQNLGENAWYQAADSQLTMLEGILGEVGTAGIADALNRFWNAWHDLSTDPESGAARATLREAGRGVASRFNRLDAQLDSRAASIDAEIAAKVAEVNNLAGQLARLNAEFARSAKPPAPLEDRRTQLLDRISELMGVRYQVDDRGIATVYAGGTALVQGDRTQTIRADNASGIVKLVIDGVDSRQLSGIGGEIGALFDVRDGELMEMRAKLDEIAASLAREVNNQHRIGYGLNGATGMDFFDPAATGMASLALSDDIELDLDNIAASRDGNPGDNQMALSIAELQTAPLLNGLTETIDQAYQATASWFGARVSETRLEAEGAKLALEQASAWRDSVSGVSLDEEMAELIRFQHAFNASAKIVGAADTMLQTIIALIR